MGRFSTSKSMRPRLDRARRRVLFCAESLESRQLLSVAAVQGAIAPALHAPAAIGPAISSPAANAGASASSFGSGSVVEVIFQFNPSFNGGMASHGFVETIFLIAEAPSLGTGVSSAAAGGSGGSSSSASPIGDATGIGSGETSGNTSITPLTATVLAGANANGHATIAIVVTTQPVVANFSSSTIPVTTQAILVTAAVEQQPLAPPALGQGFESGQTQGVDPRTGELFKLPDAPVRVEPMAPAIDVIEPYRPAADQAPAALPVQPDEAPPAPIPAIPALPIEGLPIEPAFVSGRDDAPEFPVLSPRNESRTETETPSLSMAAIIGTAAVAGGGYHLVLGRSNRFNQRWIPTRRSSRERKPQHA